MSGVFVSAPAGGGGGSAIPLSTIVAAGDIVVGTGPGAVGRLAVGGAAQVLLGGATPAWGTPPAGALSYNASFMSIDVPLPANTNTTVMSVALPIGTYDIDVQVGVLTSAVAQGTFILNFIPVDTFIGPNSDVFEDQTATATWGVMKVSGTYRGTVARTIYINVLNNTAAAAVAKALDPTGAYYVTGWNYTVIG